MSKKAERHLIVGLDIGTSKIVAIVGEVRPDRSIEIVGFGSHPSHGLKKGVVVNIDTTVETIQRAIDEAELMAGCRIHSVYAGIAGSHIRSLNSHGVAEIRDKEVSADDIERAVNAARAMPIPSDQKVLHVLPQEYAIDGQSGIREPIGMSGVRLEVNVHVVTASQSAADNVIKCVKRCGLAVDDLILEQLASAHAVLTEDEKGLGVCLVDIGGGTTDIAVYHEGSIRYTKSIPIAGDQITNDIAVTMRTPTQFAEEIKVKYACALGMLANADETIEVPSVGDRPPQAPRPPVPGRDRRTALPRAVRAGARRAAPRRFRQRARRGRAAGGRGAHRRQLEDGGRHRPGRGAVPRAGPARRTAARHRPRRRRAQPDPRHRRGSPDLRRAPGRRAQRAAAGRGHRIGHHEVEGMVPRGTLNPERRLGNSKARGGSDMSMKYELMEGVPQNAVIKVIGVGGGGCNAVQHMVAQGVVGVEFIGMNTDAQALARMNARTLQLGTNLTKGLGAGSDPGKGREAALEDRERIADVIRDADMVFVTAGMGGGTGTGAAPVVAQVAKDLGILTVAVVTKPFAMERRKRMEVAITGIDELSKYVDSLITIPNEKLLTVLAKDTTLQQAFGKVNEVLHGAVRGIADLITQTGDMNVDFADVRTVMSEMGMAMMGTGRASGHERARAAAELAISSPLLDDIKVAGAKGLLINVTAARDTLGMGEIAELNEFFDGIADPDATFKLGVAYDEALGDEIRVTIIATGLGRPVARRANEPVLVGSGLVIRQPAVVAPVAVQVPVAPPAPVAAPVAVAPVMAPPQAPAAQAVPRQVMRVANGGEVDYGAYDTPAVTRQSGSSGGSQQADLLNVPAFLRRQAD